MDKLEVHTLLCKKDIVWLIATVQIFQYYTQLNFALFIHEDGSLDQADISYILSILPKAKIINRQIADKTMSVHLANYPYCQHFRMSNHHTIFKIKLFDIFYITNSHNILYLDSDVLFCKHPLFMLECIKKKVGLYLKDAWTSYCVPFRDEDYCASKIQRYINCGLNYYPTKSHFNIDYIEECLKILYQHGSREATHPFLEQTCIAYMVTQLNTQYPALFTQLPENEYCIPTFDTFIPHHNFTVMHLNSCPLVGIFKNQYYLSQLSKINNYCL